MITIREVKSAADLKTFIYLPKKLFASNPLWVPPLYDDEKKFHSPKHNEALGYCEVKRWLGFINGKPMGRIMGIIHPVYNAKHNEKTARFNCFEGPDEPELLQQLMDTVCTWAKEKGMNKLIGPYGFSDKDPQGYKIEGFQELSVLLSPSNPPYLPQFLESTGFTKEVDSISYELSIPEKLPDNYEKICDRLLSRGYYQLKEFKSRRQLKPYIQPVLRLVNETYKDLFGFVPLSDAEIKKLAAQYLPILDPSLVKLVTNNQGELLAFVVSMPGISEGLQKSGGELFPFGFWQILKSLRSSKQLVLLLGAVKPGARGLGITAILGRSLFQSARKKGMTTIDSHLILENNPLMRAEMENLQARITKRFRVYQKLL